MECCYFNSIKVQLERVCVDGGICGCSYFNSIKVQLEHHIGVHPIFIREFQFHKGTIRTQRTRTERTLRRLFQFHKGTIRTEDGCSFETLEKHFNSIKVQLELAMAKEAANKAIFQFHKGTIRTSVPYFN